jgi:hypothetical protein
MVGALEVRNCTLSPADLSGNNANVVVNGAALADTLIASLGTRKAMACIHVPEGIVWQRMQAPAPERGAVRQVD